MHNKNSSRFKTTITNYYDAKKPKNDNVKLNCEEGIGSFVSIATYWTVLVHLLGSSVVWWIKRNRAAWNSGAAEMKSVYAGWGRGWSGMGESHVLCKLTTNV